ncbi:MAG: FxsA family protein [Oleiphilaceae bacterium]|nr:FxsA family protein [Oleiphilaceae bacterium]
MGIFLLLFIIMPIVEMAILIKVGTLIGALPTIGLVLLTAVIGAALLRQQGLATLLKANQRMSSGELPAKEVAEGLLLAIGGALLLTPGFVTDTVGFLCLIPGSRHWLAGYVMKRMVMSSRTQGFHFQAGSRGPFEGQDPFGGAGPFGPRPGKDEDVIEGEYEEERSDEARKTSDRIEKK